MQSGKRGHRQLIAVPRSSQGPRVSQLNRKYRSGQKAGDQSLLLFCAAGHREGHTNAVASMEIGMLVQDACLPYTPTRRHTYREAMLEVQPGLTGIVVSRQQLAKNQVKFPSLTPVVECWKGHLVFLCLPSSEPSVPMQEMACQWCSQKVPSTQPDRTQRFFFYLFLLF